jgi:hypothetical protein
MIAPMLLERASEAMRRLLADAGFDFGRPDPRVAWTCFKAFASVPILGVTAHTVGFECIQYDDRDDVVWLSFLRDVGGPDETDVRWQVGCAFSRIAPPHLRGASAANWWWPEHGTLDAWARDVERMAAFRDCVSLDGWKWEGVSG